jgi:hypothetical protein
MLRIFVKNIGRVAKNVLSRAVKCTVNSISNYTLWTLHRSHFKGFSANIELQVYNVTYLFRRAAEGTFVVINTHQSNPHHDDDDDDDLSIIKNVLCGIWDRKRIAPLHFSIDVVKDN